jgi:hypothetical protein
VAAIASKYREKCKKPEKSILVGDPEEESLLHLYATVQIREFLGAAVSAGSGSPVTLSAKPLYEATKGESRNPLYGERSKKRPLKKLRGHS